MILDHQESALHVTQDKSQLIIYAINQLLNAIIIAPLNQDYVWAVMQDRSKHSQVPVQPGRQIARDMSLGPAQCNATSVTQATLCRTRSVTKAFPTVRNRIRAMQVGAPHAMQVTHCSTTSVTKMQLTVRHLSPLWASATIVTMDRY